MRNRAGYIVREACLEWACLLTPRGEAIPDQATDEGGAAAEEILP
jgi:hypothetical protein